MLLTLKDTDSAFSGPQIASYTQRASENFPVQGKMIMCSTAKLSSTTGPQPAVLSVEPEPNNHIVGNPWLKKQQNCSAKATFPWRWESYFLSF